jgi:isoleucyl-tRNA synthetase
MLGALGHFDETDRIEPKSMPELERLILHRLWEVGQEVRKGYDEYDYKRVFHALMQFMTSDLSAFYFDVRKDSLYCDPISSVTRKSSLTVIDILFDRLIRWLAPIIPFTAEEAWIMRHPGEDSSVHLETFADVPDAWRDAKLEENWEKMRRVRRVVTGALEIERANKKIGSSLEAAPVIYIEDADLRAALEGKDLAEVFITSDAKLASGKAPANAFRLDDVAGVAVEPREAEGKKCARSWKISPDVGTDKEFPDITPRDAKAMREWQAART